jgi:hypothetical protein
MEEIRKAFVPREIRFKFILSLMVSSGIRVGAFNFFTLRDLQPLTVENTSQGHFSPK